MKWIIEFWNANKKGYFWSCLSFTLVFFLFYDLIFCASMNIPLPTVLDHFIWLPLCYVLIGLFALGVGIFTKRKN